MKKIPPALLVLVAIAIGYLLGTESGRQQRDVILVKLGRGPADDSAEAEATTAEESTGNGAAPAEGDSVG